MGVKIIWSQSAKTQLREVFDYHLAVASERVALRLVEKIASRVNILKDNPQAGSREESLTTYPQGFRYLVEGNYKIVYYTDENMAIISLVFDCRRDPAKLPKDVSVLSGLQSGKSEY